MSPVVAAVLSCAAGIGVDADQDSRFRPLPDSDTTVRRDMPTADGPKALPFARGRRFDSLDEYLAFRRKGGAIDLPWYEEIAPDLFELRTSMNPPPPRRRFTRAQLARQFGFSR